MKDLTVWTYVFYLSISIAITVWVGRTLHRNGRVFLVDCFRGNDGLADSVNHLLVVGFYLINAGFIALYLKLGMAIGSVAALFEALSGKVGVVLLVLGAMHFLNVFIFTRMRKRSLLENAPPPVLPTHSATAPEG